MPLSHIEILRSKAEAVMNTMDPRGVTERFSHAGLHFWVTKNFSRGVQITTCLCAKCAAKGPIT